LGKREVQLFIINITVHDNISPEQHESLFSEHVAWFKKYFATGQFVMIGPYSDQQRAGVIIANIANRDELIAVLSEDPYYPDLATYEVWTFSPKLIAQNLPQLQVM
jgi:uncharacterized protein YciI